MHSSSQTLTGQKYLVTGAGGFIGSHLVAAALARGHELAVLDNLSSGLRENVPSGVPIYAVDIRDRATGDEQRVELERASEGVRR